MKEIILCFGAHSDDLEIGMGGTIAKYSTEGKDVVGIVFSKGDKSSPWLKEEFIIETREKETEEIGKFIGYKNTIILGLPDGNLTNEIEKPAVKKKVTDLIKKYKPSQIFVTSSLDPHPDHRAVNKCVLEILDKLKSKTPAYTYEVWNVINDNNPRMYVDITKYFKKKIKALKMFKSQKHYIYPLLVPVYYRAIISGFHNKCRFAERFYKIR